MQTIKTVFQDFALPLGKMVSRGRPVKLENVKKTALLALEGEKDDISGVGQTYAAQELCVNIPADRKVHYLQNGVGHYGVFNGSRFRSEIAPRIRDFIANLEQDVARSSTGSKLKLAASNG